MVKELEIILPVHNEEKNLKDVFLKIHNSIKDIIDYSVIACEDGSTDNSKKILSDLSKVYPMKIITSEQRKFYSKAVMDGIKKAEADYLLFMDSDGQCDPEDILKLWIHRKEYDIINGYRVLRLHSLHRKICAKIFYFFYKILFNVPLRDPSMSFIMVSKKVYSNLNNYSPYLPDGFFWEFNARAFIKGYSFKEIGINHKYRTFGDTKIYHLYKIPLIGFNNIYGLIKVFWKRKKIEKNYDQE